MTNPLLELRKILNPTHAEYIGTITAKDHPEYRVQLNGTSGPVLCTAQAQYNIGQTVIISNQEIKRPTPSGGAHYVIQI